MKRIMMMMMMKRIVKKTFLYEFVPYSFYLFVTDFYYISKLNSIFVFALIVYVF